MKKLMAAIELISPADLHPNHTPRAGGQADFFSGPSTAGHPTAYQNRAHVENSRRGPIAAGYLPDIGARGPSAGPSACGGATASGSAYQRLPSGQTKKRKKRPMFHQRPSTQAQKKRATDVIMDDLPEFHPVDVPESVEDVGDVSDLDGDEVN